MMFSQFWPVVDLHYICLFWKRYNYIRKLSPELCGQKENVLSLQLFGANPRESVRNAFPQYSPFQKDLQSGFGLKKYEDKGNLDNKVHKRAC